jgi:hypothetical protein
MGILKNVLILGETMKEVFGETTNRYKKRVESQEIIQLKEAEKRKDVIGNEVILLKNTMSDMTDLFDKISNPNKDGEVELDEFEVKILINVFMSQFGNEFKSMESKKDKLGKEFKKLTDLLEGEEAKKKFEKFEAESKKATHTVKTPDLRNSPALLIPELHEAMNFINEGEEYTAVSENYQLSIFHEDNKLDFRVNQYTLHLDFNFDQFQLKDEADDIPVLLAKGDSQNMKEFEWYVDFEGIFDRILCNMHTFLRYEINILSEK